MAKTGGTKYKSLLVARYLMENCDENNPVWARDILDYLSSECGITADRRSVYADIEALRSELGMEIEEEKIGRDYKYTFLSRPLDFDELRILAECVYAAKFVSQSKAKELVADISTLGSVHQGDQLLEETFFENRARTTQKGTLSIITTIKQAMATKRDGKKCVPTKISFHYMKYSIDDLSNQITRRKGELYTVSPYRLLINDGYYYLLAFDDKYKKMRTYRVDRMKDVRQLNEPREGEEEYLGKDTQNLAKRVFGMYSGKRERVSLRFINPLLDTVIDRFGKGSDITYIKDDKDHFVIRTDVEISDQFFGWLAGFGKRVKILDPAPIAEQYKAYLDKISSMY